MKLCMPAPKCSFLLKSGITCDHSGVADASGVFCTKHHKCNLENKWTPEKEKLFKSKNVNELKEMLRVKGLKVGGVKKELINRLFAE
jgi:hypothetical protein